MLVNEKKKEKNKMQLKKIFDDFTIMFYGDLDLSGRIFILLLMCMVGILATLYLIQIPMMWAWSDKIFMKSILVFAGMLCFTLWYYVIITIVAFINMSHLDKFDWTREVKDD